MKNTLLVILLVFCLKAGYSSIDSTLNYKNQIRISLGTHINLTNISAEASIYYYGDVSQIGLPTISYIRYARKNDYHEINIYDFYLKIGEMNKPNNTDQFGMGLSYLYNLSFIRKKTTIVQPFIGFGASMRYDGMKNNIFTSDETFIRKNKINMQLICSPRVNFNIKKHWCIDLSIPFDLAAITTTITNRSSPTIPVTERKTVANNYSFFPTNLNVRLGVGYKF